MSGKSVSLQQGEGRSFWMLNGLYTVKASAEETGGEASIIEMTMADGWGPPEHSHDCGESMYVLEGTVRLHMHGESTDYGPGSFFHIPAGTLERPEPLGTVRVLAVYVPGGIDRFFAEAGEPAATNDLPPLSDEQPDIQRLVTIGEKYGLHMGAPSA